MKMRLMSLLAAFAVIGFTGCKPKDADIKAAIENKVKNDPDLSAVSVDVKDAVATVSGELKSEAAKSKVASLSADVKGLKSLNDNTTVAAPVANTPPPVIAADDPLTKGVTDATKDYPSVQASVKDGVITVTGSLSADKWRKLKMNLDQLHPKKVDGSALTIK